MNKKIYSFNESKWLRFQEHHYRNRAQKWPDTLATGSAREKAHLLFFAYIFWLPRYGHKIALVKITSHRTQCSFPVPLLWLLCLPGYHSPHLCTFGTTNQKIFQSGLSKWLVCHLQSHLTKPFLFISALSWLSHLPSEFAAEGWCPQLLCDTVHTYTCVCVCVVGGDKVWSPVCAFSNSTSPKQNLSPVHLRNSTPCSLAEDPCAPPHYSLGCFPVCSLCLSVLWWPGPQQIYHVIFNASNRGLRALASNHLWMWTSKHQFDLFWSLLS